MRVLNQERLFFPAGFNSILIKSIRTYAESFINYLLLAGITYLPFLLITEFSRMDLMDLVEFFHGNFLDIIIFLTLPTLFMNRKVFPMATISLFMQRFFASAVIISFVQLGTLLFFVTFFAQISLFVILVGMIPYVFLLFAGFFLIMENTEKLISVRTNLIKSITLVRGQFLSVFLNYMGITFLVVIPLMIFSLWYLGSNPAVMDFKESLNSSNDVDNAVVRQFFLQVQESVQAGSFKWSRIGIHIVFRPLKSLFLAFLFLGIIQRISPGTIVNFLGLEGSTEESNTTEPPPATGDDGDPR